MTKKMSPEEIAEMSEDHQCSCKELDQLRGNLTLAEDGLASAMQENQKLTRDMAALQSQWDDMQQGFVEVFGEPVRDAIELLGATERLRSSAETNEQPTALKDILACLEYRKGASYLVQVREGESESFWAALADAYSQRRPTKGVATPPFSGIVDPSISQYRFENDDGSEKATVEWFCPCGAPLDASTAVCRKCFPDGMTK